MFNFFSVKNMIKPSLCRGEMPSTGEVYKTLIRIAAPSVAEMVLTALISSLDMIMVSGLGYSAISSVGLTGQPRMLVLCMFFAINVGLTAVVARRHGEGRHEVANSTLKCMLLVIFGISVVLAGIAIVFADPLMRFAGAIEGDTLENSVLYFRIIIAAAPINALTMAITAALRGTGNTKVTLFVNGTSNIVNVIFNYLLIEGRFGFPRLEVAGAAIASVIGMACGLVLCFVVVTRPTSLLRINDGGSWKPSAELLKPVFKVGGNTMLEQVALRVGFFTFAKVVAHLGTEDFATHQICMQFLNFTFTFGDGIGAAATALVGQNMGRDRADISMLYGKAAQRIAMAVSIVLIAVIVPLREQFIMLFETDPYIVHMGGLVMIIVAIFQPFQTTSVVLSGCLRGAGDTRFVAIVFMICISVIRPLTSILAVYVFEFGLIGAWLAALIDMIIRMVAVYFRFGSFKWAKIKV